MQTTQAPRVCSLFWTGENYQQRALQINNLLSFWDQPLLSSTIHSLHKKILMLFSRLDVEASEVIHPNWVALVLGSTRYIT